MKIAQVLSNVTQIGTRSHGDMQNLDADDHPQYSFVRDVVASIPTAGEAGRLFFATDESKLYRDNGTSWDVIGTFKLAELDDVGISLSGNAGKGLRINSGETAFELFDASSVITRQVDTFDSSGTWTKPSVGTLAIVEVWGAGGGGGAGANTVNPTSGSGGASGEYIASLMPLSILGATETVTIGTGGAGRNQNTNGTGSGSAGGNTQFGSLITANGGGGGNGASGNPANSAAATGGTGGTNYPISYVEQDGNNSSAASSSSGAQATDGADGVNDTTATGGASAASNTVNVTASDGAHAGAGGGGAAISGFIGNATAGNGANGRVRVTVI